MSDEDLKIEFAKVTLSVMLGKCTMKKITSEDTLVKICEISWALAELMVQTKDGVKK